MLPAIKAEFRKLLTVRSTYILLFGFLLLGCFFSFYVHGFKDAGDPAFSGNSALDHARASLFVAGSITQMANIISVACALIALLVLAHEYRYNTIVYTLTASNSRSKVFGAKILAVMILVLVYAVLATTILLPLVWAGASAGGHTLPHQTIDYLTYFAKIIFFCESFTLAGLLFITLIRNQVGAIAALLILPNTVEGLLSLLLKNNSVYLPFTALQQVVQPPVLNGIKVGAARDASTGYLSAPRGALVFLVYIIIGYIIGWYLFLKRDAT